MIVNIIGLAVLAYLIGSIPSALWMGRAFHGIDVREHGSRNAGATNTFRVLGKSTGIKVLLMDIFKGFTATNLIYLLPEAFEMSSITQLKILLGAMAVIGHIYPVFAGFRGGKGIASLLGMVLAINALIAIGVILVFLVVQLSTHMVSAGSIVAAMSFAIFAWIIYGYDQPVLIIFGLVATLTVLFTHRSNVRRILHGTEKKIFLFKPPKESDVNEVKETN